jgi:hypothetical protein
MTYYGRWTYKFEEAALRKAAGVRSSTNRAGRLSVGGRAQLLGGEQFDVGRDDGGASPLRVRGPGSRATRPRRC